MILALIFSPILIALACFVILYVVATSPFLLMTHLLIQVLESSWIVLTKNEKNLLFAFSPLVIVFVAISLVLNICMGFAPGAFTHTVLVKVWKWNENDRTYVISAIFGFWLFAATIIFSPFLIFGAASVGLIKEYYR